MFKGYFLVICAGLLWNMPNKTENTDGKSKAERQQQRIVTGVLLPSYE